MSQNTMLPGFYLTIEDNQTTAQNTAPLQNVYLIYAIMSELMRTEDSEGNIEEVYVEPNKPLVISDSNEAIKTLEVSDLVLNREVKNIIKLIPSGEDTSIALVRIVKRDGESPSPESLVEMYEALDFAFENTENFPAKEIIVAGLSLDDAVALNPKEIEKVKVVDNENLDFVSLVDKVTNATGSGEILKPRKFELSLEVTRVNESLEETKDGVYNSFEFKVDGTLAKAIKEEEEGKLVDAKAVAVMQYVGEEGQKTASVQSVTTELPAQIKLAESTLTLTLSKDIKIKVDDETVVVLKSGDIVAKAIKPTDSEGSLVATVEVQRAADNADILTRIMQHNATITATQNNCMTFLSPEPPKNNSPKAREEYVERCLNLHTKMRDRLSTINSNGKKVDLGMFLTVPVGVNMVDELGGVTGYPQARISTISQNKIITKKTTTAFEVGDIIEVYTHNKLDQISFQANVESVGISDVDTTEITLDKEVPEELTSSVTPKYIMNINNKDFKGTYLARQWSNVCNEVGVIRSPAGITWNGECQMRFSEKELLALDANKFCTVQQEQGKTTGFVSRSQLMTGTSSQFQKIETLKTIYDLTEKCKNVVMPYRGERIDDGTDLALIKTEIEDVAFKPAVGVYITSGYELKLSLKQLTNPNGQKEKALYIDYTVKEIETLALIRITARLF